jgi:hypothetical protein
MTSAVTGALPYSDVSTASCLNTRNVPATERVSLNLLAAPLRSEDELIHFFSLRRLPEYFGSSRRAATEILLGFQSMTALTIRQWHTYIGLLAAPSVIFFALTGAAQLFDLHEPHGDYHPLPLMAKLGAVHRDQVFAQPHAHEAEEAEHPNTPEDQHEANKDSADAEQNQEHAGTLVLKCFFLLVALGLCVSSCLGIYLGLAQSRSWPLAWVLFAGGCLIPVTILVIA